MTMTVGIAECMASVQSNKGTGKKKYLPEDMSSTLGRHLQ